VQKTIHISTSKPNILVDITSEIEAFVKQSTVMAGIVKVYVPRNKWDIIVTIIESR